MVGYNHCQNSISKKLIAPILSPTHIWIESATAMMKVYFPNDLQHQTSAPSRKLPVAEHRVLIIISWYHDEQHYCCRTEAGRFEIPVAQELKSYSRLKLLQMNSCFHDLYPQLIIGKRDGCIERVASVVLQKDESLSISLFGNPVDENRLRSTCGIPLESKFCDYKHIVWTEEMVRIG